MTLSPLHDPLAAMKFVAAFAQTNLMEQSPDDYLATAKAFRQFIDRDTSRAAIGSGVLQDCQEQAAAMLRTFVGHGLALSGDLVLPFAVRPREVRPMASPRN